MLTPLLTGMGVMIGRRIDEKRRSGGTPGALDSGSADVIMAKADYLRRQQGSVGPSTTRLSTPASLAARPNLLRRTLG